MNTNGWVEVTSCPVCKGDQLAPFASVVSAPYFEAAFVDGTIHLATLVSYKRCGECGLVIQSPRMSDERIKKYYASGAYRATLGISQEAMDEDEERRANEVMAFLEKQQVAPRVHVDIGASRGLLLEKTKAKYGAAVLGIDPNIQYS